MLSGLFHYPGRFLHHLVRKNDGRVYYQKCQSVKTLSSLNSGWAVERPPVADNNSVCRCWNPFCVWRRRPIRLRSLSSYDNLIPEAEQRQGLPEECEANTAYVKIRSVGLKKYVAPKKTSISTTKDRRYEANQIKIDPNISIVWETLATIEDPSPGGGGNNLSLPLASIHALLWFLAILYCI